MNYADLFRMTLPETALEIAALVVLVVDLGFLRRATLRVRIFVASILGVFGCGAAIVAMTFQPPEGLGYPGSTDLLLVSGGYAAAAQAGILVLTVFTLFLFIETDFTRHAGEFVAVILMAATGGLLIAAAQDLLVIFVGLELLSLGLYILTAFAKQSGKSAEGALKYYLFGGMSAAFLLFGFSYLYGLAGSTNLHQIMLAMYGPNAVNATPLLYVALVMITAGLGFKVAAVPFHLWAPDTYEGAPAPSAAFIASVSKVASFALLIGIGTAASHVFGEADTVRVSAEFSMNPPAKFIGFQGPWSVILALVSVASMAARKSRRTGADQCAPIAGLLGNCACRLHSSGARLLLAFAAEHECGAVLHPYLRTDDDWRFRCGGRGGAGIGQRSHGCISRAEQAKPAAGSRFDGAVSFARGHSSARWILGQVQSVRSGVASLLRRGSVHAGGAGGRDECGISLLLPAGDEARVRDAGC